MAILSEYWLLILLFFLVALFYSTVGFGGGSSYLAILSLFNLPFGYLRSLALLCNIVVVSNGSFHFARSKLLDLKKTLPLVILSIPLSFAGGALPIKEKTFFILLGLALLFSAFLLWFQPQQKNIRTSSFLTNMLIGGAIGFFSGMVGIGGGIFLSPFLYLVKWDNPHKIAATSSFFILVNSISGLLGQFNNPDFTMDWPLAFILMISVAVGGFIGSRLAIYKFSPIRIKKATALLILYVGVSILIKYLK